MHSIRSTFTDTLEENDLVFTEQVGRNIGQGLEPKQSITIDLIE
jgi:hypothetical protein